MNRLDIFEENHYLQQNPTIIFDEKFKFSDHISAPVKQSFKLMNMILHNTKSRNPLLLLLIHLFKVYIRPRLEYNAFIFNPCLLCDIDLLELVQRRYTKLVGKRCGFSVSYNERLRHFKLKSLEERRIYFDLVLLYKIQLPDKYFQLRAGSYYLVTIKWCFIIFRIFKLMILNREIVIFSNFIFDNQRQFRLACP